MFFATSRRKLILAILYHLGTLHSNHLYTIYLASVKQVCHFFDNHKLPFKCKCFATHRFLGHISFIFTTRGPGCEIMWPHPPEHASPHSSPALPCCDWSLAVGHSGVTERYSMHFLVTGPLVIPAFQRSGHWPFII